MQFQIRQTPKAHTWWQIWGNDFSVGNRNEVLNYSTDHRRSWSAFSLIKHAIDHDLSKTLYDYRQINQWKILSTIDEGKLMRHFCRTSGENYDFFFSPRQEAHFYQFHTNFLHCFQTKFMTDFNCPARSYGIPQPQEIIIYDP